MHNHRRTPIHIYTEAGYPTLEKEMLIIQSEEGTPPILNNLESTSELMVAGTDYAGVEIRSLHTYPVLGPYKYLNAHLKNARTVSTIISTT